MISLHNLLSSADDAVLVGYRDGSALHWAALRQQIAKWQLTLTNCPATQIILYQRDSLAFAAALLAIWHSGKTAIIPGDNLPGTLQLLIQHYHYGIGELEGGEGIQLLTPSLDAAPLNTALSPRHPALVIFTSGSSGEPKPIHKRLDQLESELQHLQQLWGTQAANCRVIASVSHQHIYGLLFKVLWPLCTGRPIINEQLSYPEEIVQALQGDPAMLISSPAHLKRLPETLPWQQITPPVLTFSSGGPLPQVDSLRAAALLRCPISEVYGSSESGGVAQRQQHDPQLDAPWQPLPGVEIAQAENCALMVRSAHLEDDQWYTSADHVTLLADGSFRLSGRLDRIAKVEGKRISLERIEALLNQHPWLIEARVLQLTDEREQLAAVVVLSRQGNQQLASGKHPLNQQLRAALANHIDRIAIPRKWRYVQQLPHNDQGKITRASLLALFEKEL